MHSDPETLKNISLNKSLSHYEGHNETKDRTMIKANGTLNETCMTEFRKFLNSRKEKTFIEEVIRLIDEKGYKDPEVYRRAHLDRRIFSKMLSNLDYVPSKDTAIAVTFGLMLSVDEARSLLCKAGFTLSHSSKRDLIIELFLAKGLYDMEKLNIVLSQMGERTLGRAR